jgi:glucosamine-phosphate N-acetyltransferase
MLPSGAELQCPLLEVGAMSISVREQTGFDIGSDFLDTLAALAEVKLTREEAVEIFRQRLAGGARSYVATDGDRIVGTLTLLVERKFIHHGGRVGHIEDVVVHGEYQKRGIGQALVRHAVEEARQLGCYKVILNCFEERVGFYESVGFRRHDVGMRVDVEQGPAVQGLAQD